MVRWTLRSGGLVAVLSLSAGSLGASDQEEVGPAGFRIRGAMVTLPFQLTNGFPFLWARVNGTRGVFMLDTGCEFPLFLNKEFVELPVGDVLGEGAAGSGQKIVVESVPRVKEVSFAGLRWTGLENARCADLSEIATGIGVPLLGFIGWTAFPHHAIEFDYRHQVAVLHEVNEEGMLIAEPPAGTDWPEPLAVLPFESSASRWFLPVIEIEIGERPWRAVLDTGVNIPKMTPALRRTAAEAGLLDTWSRDHDARGNFRKGMETHVITEAWADGQDLSIPAVRLGPISGAELSLGYTLLRQFRCVWNPRKKTISLLSRTDGS